MHRALKVALQPWPARLAILAFVQTTSMRAIRHRALDRARRSNDGQVNPVLEGDLFVYKRHWPRSTLTLLRVHQAHRLVPRSTLPSEDRGVTLRSRFFRRKALKQAIQTQWMATTLI